MEITSITNVLQGVLDKIPSMIVTVRELITKVLTTFNLSGISLYLFLAMSGFLAYLWIKQFISTGWAKLSTLINLILLTILIYLTITKVGVAI